MFRLSVLFTIIAVYMVNSYAFAKEGVLLGMPDPAVIQADDGSFYIFATGKGLPYYHSKDLVNWKKVGTVFDTPVPGWSKKAIPETSGIWAPDIVKFDDKYFVYYCVSSFGSQRSIIGVATNTTLDHTSPNYKWIDQGMVVESFPDKCDFNAIDPAAFQQEYGGTFMVWGSFWGGIKFIELNPETGKPLHKELEISSIAARPNHSGAVEGAYMVQNRDYYYMFVSFDSCCNGAESTYRVMVGRSKDPLGPYVDYKGTPMTKGGGTLVLRNNNNWRGPGHNSVLTTDKGSWMVHHTYDTFHLEKQRILQIRPIYWGDDGWPVVGEPLSKTNPMSTEKADLTADDIIGSWRMSTDYSDEKIIDLLPHGRIAFHPESRWKLNDNKIMLFWRDKQSKKDLFVDACTIEPSGNVFIGRNLTGVVIRGKKIIPQ